MTEIAYLTATELDAAYRAGELSPVEVTTAVLDRVDAVNEAVNAYCLVDRDGALTAARAAEERRRTGTALGPFDGVPVSIKDVLMTAGLPTLRGSRTVPTDQAWDADAPCTARLREAGAVILGKTTTPEFGWKGVTDSPVYGVTRNPWDPSRTPGGSSGGAAAAVALGLGPLAMGTDGGGSVRIPGAFTGVFALKPTYGAVPAYPSSPFGTLAHIGPMTWTVDDAVLAMDVLTRYDPRDWSALPPPATPYAAAVPAAAGVAGRRVAYSPSLGYAAVDPEVAALVARAVEAFTELGAEVEERDPGFADPAAAFETLWFAGAAKLAEPLDDAGLARLDPGLREVCEAGARVSAAAYLDATAVRMAMGTLMGEFHETYDLLLTPTLPIPAFPAGQEVPDGSADPRWPSWTPFTFPFNLTQQPAATVPCGFTSGGLPVGLQIVGARHADALVLAAAKAFQDARPWQGRRPQL